MKKFLTWVCLAVFLLVGINAAVTMASLPRTYDGSQANVPAYELRRDPASYDDSTADGAAAGIVQQEANPDANIIFGATSSPDFEDEMRVTVIATGFEQRRESAPEKTETAAPAAAEPASKAGDISDIDEIFNIFKR